MQDASCIMSQLVKVQSRDYIYSVLDKFLLSFIPLLVAFDVLGLLPIYMKFTASLTAGKRLRQLRDSLVTAFFTTLFFVIVGNRIMAYLGILLKDFFIAGGIVLLVTAVRDILAGHGGAVTEDELFGVVPLGVPLLAGPAVLATSVIITSQYGFSYFLVSLVLNLAIGGLILRFSDIVLKLLGGRVIEAISKVFSLFIASIAVMFIRRGLQGA